MQRNLRGRLGQPLVPVAQSRGGLFRPALVDHRSADVALVNFVGDVVAFGRTCSIVLSADVTRFRQAGESGACAGRTAIRQGALPDSVSPRHYHSRVSAKRSREVGRVAAWNETNIRAELDRVFDWPVFPPNDVSAAAELMFGAGAACAGYNMPIDVIGGGLRARYHLFPGRNKLAGCAQRYAGSRPQVMPRRPATPTSRALVPAATAPAHVVIAGRLGRRWRAGRMGRRVSDEQRMPPEAPSRCSMSTTW